MSFRISPATVVALNLNFGGERRGIEASRRDSYVRLPRSANSRQIVGKLFHSVFNFCGVNGRCRAAHRRR